VRRGFVFLGGLLLGCGSDTPFVPDASVNDAAKCDPGSVTQGCACESALYPKRVCYDGPPATRNVGVCLQGTRACVGGVVSACEGEVLPTAEVCNGKDDDCNGVVDDIPVTAQGTYGKLTYDCDAGGVGACAFGKTVCTANGPTCQSIVGTGAPEICNGIDDDCNGSVDDNLNNINCTVDQAADGGLIYGICVYGSGKCVNGSVACAPGTPRPQELCNGVDDNCNGQIDEYPVYDATYGYLCTYGCTNGTCYNCPQIFVHDGDAMRFVTTVGGASVIGQPKHVDEGKDVDFEPMLARLDGIATTGRVRARLLAADDEIVYLARASFVVVTHERGCEVFTSSSIQWNTLDRTDPGEMIALRTAAMRTPIEARWMGDVDVTRELATLDDRAAAFDPGRDNFYEIDFGPVGDARDARLVLDGFKRKVDRDLARRGVAQTRPRIEIERADGSWGLAKWISTPRGEKKAVVFALGDVAWPSGRYRMRIYTGTHEAGTAMWMLDRARLTEEAPRPIELRSVEADRATLSFAGAPTVIGEGDLSRSLRSFDDGKGRLDRTQRTFGRFTRYGDVLDLVKSEDARLVVMRRGDALDVELDAGSSEDERTLFFSTSLVYKPRAFFGRTTAQLARVEPMPYPGMHHYPPAKPATSDRAYVDAYQTRVYDEEDERWGA
jgi:hypothetical protein